jgi:CheY-like chemotaxis protein
MAARRPISKSRTSKGKRPARKAKAGAARAKRAASKKAVRPKVRPRPKPRPRTTAPSARVAPGTATPAPGAPAEPRVLIADDDPDIRSIVSGKLAQMNCKVLVAQSGDEALARAVVERPDVILLDVMMPGLNGWEVARELRKRPDFDSVGLIMLTGVGETVNAATAPLYGADDRIDKPFQLSELEYKVRRVLSEKRRAKSP